MTGTLDHANIRDDVQWPFAVVPENNNIPFREGVGTEHNTFDPYSLLNCSQ